MLPRWRAGGSATSSRPWLRSDSPKTLGAMTSVFAEKSFALGSSVDVRPASPRPTGGVSHVFEVITVVLAAQMVLGRRMVWLPERWKGRQLGEATTEKAIPFIIRRIRQVERFSKPRGAWLFELSLDRPALRPRADDLRDRRGARPAVLGARHLARAGRRLLVALAIILEDVAVLALGLVVGTGGVVLIFTIGAALVRLLGSLF